MDSKTVKNRICPSEHKLNAFLTGILTGHKLEETEKHIAGCPICIYKIAEANEVLTETGIKKLQGGSMDILKKINIWLVLCIGMFLSSFIFSRYFIQFTAGAVLLGTKWIVDSRNKKMLIMIYEAWKHGGKEDASRVIRSIESRIRR